MNATDIKLMSLYEEYLPYLRKERCSLPFCSDEYEQEDNIRLLFGNFSDARKKEKSENITLVEMMSLPCKYNDADYINCSFENEPFMKKYFSTLYRPNADYMNINKYINGGKLNNYVFITLNPFEEQHKNMSEKDYKEKQREFLTKQINILHPEALIIASDLSENSINGHKEPLYSKKIKEVFGNDIVFSPLPLSPSFIQKWEAKHVCFYHPSLIEGVKGLKTKIYVYKYDEYDWQEHLKDLVQIISNHIITNTKKT